MDYDLQNIPDVVLKRVWDRVDAMEAGQILIIKEHANGHIKLFTECLKRYCDCYPDGTFNDDYTVFKKITFIP